MFIYLSFKQGITAEQHSKLMTVIQQNRWTTKNGIGDKYFAVEIGKVNETQIGEAEQKLKALSFVRTAERQIIFRLSPG